MDLDCIDEHSLFHTLDFLGIIFAPYRDSPKIFEVAIKAGVKLEIIRLVFKCRFLDRSDVCGFKYMA